MDSMFEEQQRKVGMSPGTVMYTGRQKMEQVLLSKIWYDETELEERQNSALTDVLVPESSGVTWLNLHGLHNVDLIKELGEAFGLHPLTLEDIVSTGQRPKLEVFDDYLYIVLRMLSLDADGHPQDEQLSIILTDTVVLSFQERPDDVFDPLRERIRHGKGRVRKLGADYLAYALTDSVVDSYFHLLEHYSDQLEELEDEILLNPSPKVLEKVNDLKREILFLRRSVWPLREVLSSLQREESNLICAQVDTYIRDAYDHAVQIIDTVETLRELLAGLHDFYLSSLSFKMNEIMKVLTIVGTIFIPLSFLVGVYGMNFDRMPELHYRYGYPLLWLFMVLVVGGMLGYFRRKKWL